MTVSSRAILLDPSGYFTCQGERFVPVGVNYWPGSCGVEMWQQWPEEEIRRDLDLLPALGLNTIRFFLRWQDFEVQPGQYDASMFARLEQFLGWCRAREIYAQPSLFVGWMSGGSFWPAWRNGRNTFSDPYMTERAAAFARRASEVIAPFHDGLLGVDQGNELCALVDAHIAPPAAVKAWCEAVSTGIKAGYPDALIVSGNEQTQVASDTGWRLGAQPGTDYYSMHGYPVPGWHAIGFDGMTDPFAQSLLPTYVSVARAYGPVMLQEFGTIATFGVRQQDSYLRGMLPAAWQAGANGFLWWCLKDITARVHPYTSNGFESTLGLVNASGKVKPGLEYYLEFTRSLSDRPAPNLAALGTGIYLPRDYYSRDEEEALPNQPRLLARGLTVCRYLLERMGVQSRMVRGGSAIDPRLKTLIIPGGLISPAEVDHLLDWVAAGGRLVWSGPDPVNWGDSYLALLGAAPVDYRTARPVRLEAFGQSWLVEAFPRNNTIEVEPRGAQTLVVDQHNRPAVLRNTVGQGTVTYILAQLEETIARAAHDRQERDRWEAFYRGLLE